MACGCASRMREILRMNGHVLEEDGVWRRPDDPFEVPDERIEEEHFKVLIETINSRLFGQRAANFLKRIT